MTEITDGGGLLVAAHDAGCDVKVVSQGWKDDRAAKPGEKANAMLHGRVFVNGREIPQVTAVEVKTRGGDFSEVVLHLVPGSVEHVTADDETWAQLNRESRPGT